MTFLASDIIERFYMFLWPMLRISALMLTAPPFSSSVFNLRVRTIVALALTWMIYPLYNWPTIDPLSAPGLVEVFNQIVIGASMGLVLQVVVAALVLAGHAISSAMGLTMSSMIDPSVGNVPILSQFLIILSTLIFVGTGGHAMLLGLVLESFRWLPIGQSLMNQDAYGLIVRWSSMIFLGGLLLSLPVMVALLFINIGLGVVTRAAPSLNIFAVGFPAMIIAGFLVLFVSMDSIGGRISWLWVQGFDTLRALLGAPNG
ncbi:MAG: flagellar biosynthetic protein FliR [Betaproteobacteria bacterium]|nr:flagellar biosynthetic protein FliR [Betaproteobacteria bacterium]